MIHDVERDIRESLTKEVAMSDHAETEMLS